MKRNQYFIVSDWTGGIYASVSLQVVELVRKLQQHGVLFYIMVINVMKVLQKKLLVKLFI